MKKHKSTWILGLAIFSAFFGAGNLILPPMLGYQSGALWPQSSLGFLITALLIPFLALMAHAKLQGTMVDFGRKVSSGFGLILSIFIYAISVTLPCPRTAAVTHEMAIAPFFGSSSLWTSTIYFALVFLFVVNRGKALDFLGRFLTPMICLIVLCIVGIGLFLPESASPLSMGQHPFATGFIEGYQTYDAIGGMLIGGVLVISVQKALGIQKGPELNLMIRKSGSIAIGALFLIYLGMIFLGSHLSGVLGADLSRTDLLTYLVTETLGGKGQILLSVLIALACFSTAVGVVMGTSDFFQGLAEGSKNTYRLTAFLSCAIGVLVGQFDVGFIIAAAVPILYLVYPLVIVLIVLNVMPENYADKVVFRTVALATLLFSIPTVIDHFNPQSAAASFFEKIPLFEMGLAWIIPATLTWALANLWRKVNPQP